MVRSVSMLHLHRVTGESGAVDTSCFWSSAGLRGATAIMRVACKLDLFGWVMEWLGAGTDSMQASGWQQLSLSVELAGHLHHLEGIIPRDMHSNIPCAAIRLTWTATWHSEASKLTWSLSDYSAEAELVK
eukprot:1141915-Pelagomonas_calceolata.AAC.3